MKKWVLVPLLLAAACGGSHPASDFTLAVIPASLTLAPGATGTATVNVRRAFQAPVGLSLAGVPDGVVVETPAIAAGSNTAVITFHNRRTGKSVTGVLVTVLGTSEGRTASAEFAMTVQCPASPAPDLSVLAGAAGGAGIADDVGSDARFFQPAAIVGDESGNIYVADTSNGAIRRLVVATGVVSTVAGGFNQPFGITRLGGFLYVADTFDHVIERVDPASGAVTVVAGTPGQPGATDGPALAARFDTPFGIATDGDSLYVADTGNSTIRRIDLATGSVATLAGSPGMTGSADGICDLARFSGLAGIAADGAGNLYVGDTRNHTIRKIEIASEMVTTLAGLAGQAGVAGGIGSAARFNGPTGVAADGAGHLLVADTENHLIRQISLATGAVEVVGGAASPSCEPALPDRFCFPRGVTVDRGAWYVADTAADAIVTLVGGHVGAVAGLRPQPGSADGTTLARFSVPLFIAGDGADTVYVPDSKGGAVRAVSISSGQVTTLAKGFDAPEGVAFDGDVVYVADTLKDTIHRIAIATGQVTLLAGKAFEPGLLDGAGEAARFSLPVGLAADHLGHLYVTDDTAIRVIDLATQNVTTLAGSATAGSADGTGADASFDCPNGLALDREGNLYVADSHNQTIRKIAVVSGAVTTLAGLAGTAGSNDGNGADARFNSPDGVLFDGGRLFVSDTGNSTVRRIDLATGKVTTVLGQPGIAGLKTGPAPARLNTPEGLAIFAGGRLVISDSQENVLISLSP